MRGTGARIRLASSACAHTALRVPSRRRSTLTLEGISVHPLAWLARLMFLTTAVERWFVWRRRLSVAATKPDGTVAVTAPPWHRVLFRVIGEMVVAVVLVVGGTALVYVAVWYLVDTFGPIPQIHKW